MFGVLASLLINLPNLHVFVPVKQTFKLASSAHPPHSDPGSADSPDSRSDSAERQTETDSGSELNNKAVKHCPSTKQADVLVRVTERRYEAGCWRS